LANPNVQPDFFKREIWLDFEQNICKKNSLLLSLYFLDMTNTVFSMFQTQYILNFLSASRSSGTLVFSKH
jgi:hypothetical protein